MGIRMQFIRIVYKHALNRDISSFRSKHILCNVITDHKRNVLCCMERNGYWYFVRDKETVSNRS